MKTFDEYRREQLQNPEIKAEYDKLEQEYIGIALEVKKLNRIAAFGAILGAILLHVIAFVSLLMFGQLHPLLNIAVWTVIISYFVSLLIVATYICFLRIWE